MYERQDAEANAGLFLAFDRNKGHNKETHKATTVLTLSYDDQSCMNFKSQSYFYPLWPGFSVEKCFSAPWCALLNFSLSSLRTHWMLRLNVKSYSWNWKKKREEKKPLRYTKETMKQLFSHSSNDLQHFDISICCEEKRIKRKIREKDHKISFKIVVQNSIKSIVKEEEEEDEENKRQALNFSQSLHHRKSEDEKKILFLFYCLSHHVLSVIHFRFNSTLVTRREIRYILRPLKADEVDVQSNWLTYTQHNVTYYY